ncbi:10-deacetylbaccatin III 10-O-acetyltransferase [Spatholobus suberectus]|nr:10-deacetylbaccatin III 10-O-acetyltransferase [Spatholobus suberectus]
MGAENVDFSVSVINEEVVAAVLPMQEHWLPLSNLDLLLPPLDVGVFFCYKNPMPTSTTLGDSATNKMTFGSMVRSLKKALAQALISYYAFAGEVVSNNMGEPEVLCNNRGVDFVEAVADVELKCLNFYNPDDTIEGKFVPKKKNGVLAVQATSLKCGGIVVACTFDHRIADAYSTNMFLVSWAEMAQPTKPNTVVVATTTFCLPCIRRSLLNPRHPGSFHPSLHHMYIPISELPPPPATTSTALLSRIYYVPANQLHRMQSLAAIRTKLECFSAFLWKMVARATSRDKNSKSVVAKMGIVAECLNPDTLWDSLNDAVNTIIRGDETTETGDLLPPCVEAALNLGCKPVRTSRSDRHNNPRTSPRRHTRKKKKMEILD